MSESTNAATSSPRLRQLLITGGFVLAAVAAPIAVSTTVHGGSTLLPAVASCPEGEVLDPATGECRPAIDEVTAPAPGVIAPEPNPINPEGAELQPGSITSSQPGEVGRLPEVDGIPCDGANTGKCIGLSENQPNFQQPHSTVSSSP